MRILILCTGNSCRSQMAEGILRDKLKHSAEIFSAGTRPEKSVNPFAVRAMNEIGIDMTGHFPKNVDQFTDTDFDFVITVCDNAKASCPVFAGRVKNRLHIGFPDPADAVGTDEEIIEVYRRSRDSIAAAFEKFIAEYLPDILQPEIGK